MSETKLTCDMTNDCTCKIAYIDIKGFIYCDSHGKARKLVNRCRKLKPKEIKQLQSGQPLAQY